MILLTIPLFFVCLYVLKQINSKDKPSMFDKFGLAILLITAIVCPISLMYKVISMLGYEEGEIPAYTMLITAIITLYVVISFTKPQRG